MVRKRPCSICRRWFLPDARVGKRQRACSSAECQASRRQKTQAAWRAANPDYFAARRMTERASGAESEPAAPSPSSRPPPRAPPPVGAPPPLDRLPWDVAQDAFGVQGADFIGLLGRVLLRVRQDQRRAQVLDTS